MAHSRFDQFGASFAVFGNPIQDWVLHPMLQDEEAFAAFAAVFPELLKLVVDGVPQVENYTVKHVVSVPANNQMPHQAIHAESPSLYRRMIIVGGVTLSTIENSAFCAMHASGIIFSKNHVEHLAISNAAGNTETRRANRAIGDDVYRLVRDPGFVTTGAAYVAGLGFIAEWARPRWCNVAKALATASSPASSSWGYSSSSCADNWHTMLRQELSELPDVDIDWLCGLTEEMEHYEPPSS